MRTRIALLTLPFAFAALIGAQPASALDVTAGQALAKKEGCLKCHGINEEKEAKSLTDIARKYKGKPDASARIMEQITSGQKVKLADGGEEEHKIVKSKDKAALGNMVDWIRSLAK